MSIIDNETYLGLQETLKQVIKLIKSDNIKHGIELTITPTDKFAVFGDIHGDIDTLTKAYKLAKSKNVKYFIFCGDYIDKGVDSLSCLKFVLDHFVSDYKHFIPLMGNHEMMLAGDLFIGLSKQPELIRLLSEVIGLMPIALLININGKKIFCSHGAYPFIYKHKYIHIEDEFDDVWQLISPINKPEDLNELIYESNTSFTNLSPVGYINKLYNDLAYQSSLIVENIYDINMYSARIVAKLKEIKEAIKTNDQTKINELITQIKADNFFKYFIVKLNDYKSYLAKLKKAQQAVIYIRDYVGWGDMYMADQCIDDIETKEEYLATVDKCKTQFFKANRFEVKRYNLSYSVEQLKQWMKDSNINLFIRGHQLTLNCCEIIDLKTNSSMPNPKIINYTSESMNYITLHTTKSYKKLDEEYYGIGKFVICDDKCFEVVGV